MSAAHLLILLEVETDAFAMAKDGAIFELIPDELRETSDGQSDGLAHERWTEDVPGCLDAMAAAGWALVSHAACANGAREFIFRREV